MAHPDYTAFLHRLVQAEPQWQSGDPPATPDEVRDVAERARRELGEVLHADYLQLVRVINGSGRSVCFYGTHTRTVEWLGREMVAEGTVDANLGHRQQGFADQDETVYAQGDELIFLPGDAPGSWIGRDLVSRQVLWRGKSFLDLVRYAYMDDATGAGREKP